MRDDDLREAARRGWLLLPEAPGGDGVRLEGRVLRFDPDLPWEARAALVRELLARADE